MMRSYNDNLDRGRLRFITHFTSSAVFAKLIHLYIATIDFWDQEYAMAIYTPPCTEASDRAPS